MFETGYFVFSLDTELGSGYFDYDTLRHEKFSADGLRERLSISRLIDLFESYGITGTWAIVGHLFYQQCEKCEICPMMAWQGKYESFKEVYGTAHPLWYGEDVVDELLTRGVHQELGFHGYTHVPFDEQEMTLQEAEIEIKEWIRVASRKKILPGPIVFPRDKAGYLEVLSEHGFVCFRSEPKLSIWIRNKYFGRYLKTLDHLLAFSKIPIYDDALIKTGGLIDIRTSQHIFGFNRRFELWLDSRNLPYLRLKRIAKGIQRAAAEKKMIHIWAHPWEFQTEDDFKKLQYIFDVVSEEINRGKIRSVGMAEMSDILMRNHTG